MPRPLKDTITIADADGEGAHPYKLLEDAQGVLLWGEEGVSDDNMPPGEPVIKKWRFWGGGMAERQDMGRGGYYYSENAAHNDPFALKPRPTIGTLTLAGNTVPIERFFEASDGTNWYLYALAGAKSFKIKDITSTPALAETKDFTPTTPVNFKTGSYIGNGSNDRKIFGLGFQPDIVLLKADGSQWAVLKTASMAATYSKTAAGAALETGYIDTLDSDGFTVDASSNVQDIEYFWAAWEKVAGYIDEGSYTGDGNDDRWFDADDEATMNFNPDLVIIAGDTATLIVAKPSTLAGDLTQHWCTTQADAADHIQALGTGGQKGFQLGTDGDVNANTETYYYIAFKALSEQFCVGTYTGDAADDRDITGPGLRPACLFVTATARAFCWRIDKNDGDDTLYFANSANGTDHIQTFLPNGFQVGTHVEVNANGETFHYMAWKQEGAAACGKPAIWNTITELPLGNGMDSRALTTVHNEGGAGDDTWTRRSGLRATHFQRRGNKIAKATDNEVSLCSADDLDNLGNWGADYPVGPPDTVITDLVEWGQELAVCHTGGMTMFDGVATSREQIPLMGGLTDDDNGKNTLRMASFIFYPSADGFYRWRYGAHRRIDPEADPFYGPAEETSNEPVNLKHYGSAFCGDHIYHAAYDGTNYLLLHGKLLNEAGDILWDCLLSTTNAIKAIYVDRNRYLWFGYGNNLAYIKLSQGGEPDGGNFGNASLVTTIYERELILADDAEVRLRMVKAIVRNMDDGGANTYKWELHASRDGAAFGAQIGEDIQGAAMDGVNKRYWTAASNLKARRLRLKEVGTATAGYTPAATAPEIIFAGVWGETVPDDATIIRCVIDLERSGRSAKTVKAELKARENAGVVQVRDPIEDTMLSMIIYRCDLAEVRQKGHEDPRAAMVVYMRYGDVS